MLIHFSNIRRKPFFSTLHMYIPSSTNYIFIHMFIWIILIFFTFILCWRRDGYYGRIRRQHPNHIRACVHTFYEYLWFRYMHICTMYIYMVCVPPSSYPQSILPSYRVCVYERAFNIQKHAPDKNVVIIIYFIYMKSLNNKHIVLCVCHNIIACV